jgi:hypothetical protein
MGWSLLLPAGAQITTQTQLQLVAMVPFQNLAKGGPEILGEQATNAITQALLDTQVYDVRPIEESKQKMADLGLRAPLSEAELDRLGEAMGVGGVVFGEVRSAGVRKLTRSSQGEVTLMVAIYDIATGTIRNGTITTGKSSFSGGEIGPEKLIDEALNQAAYQAVKEIKSNRPITGIVQSVQGKDVAIRVGETSGVRENMKFVVIREGQRVGIIKAGRVSKVFTDGQLEEGQARTGDRILQVFEIPAKGLAVELPDAKVTKDRGMGKLALAVLAGLLLAGMSKSKGGASSTTGVTATAVSNTADVQTQKTPMFSGVPLDDFVHEGSDACTQVRWKSATSASETILAYEIWRDGNTLAWTMPAIGGSGNYFFDPLPALGQKPRIIVDPNTGVGQYYNLGREIDSFSVNEPITLFATTVTFDDDTHPTQLDYDIQGSAVVKDYKIDNVTQSYLVWIGLYGGEHHVYQVKKVFSRRYQLADGTFQWEISRASLPGRAVVATLIGPSTLQMPANNELVTDATAVTFGFNPSFNVDDFILQVSLDSQFSRNVTGNDNLTLLDGTHSTSELLLTTLNLEGLLGSLPSGTTVFWRIGARWRGDTFMPLPYPLVGKAPPDAYRYVFSETRQLVTP